MRFIRLHFARNNNDEIWVNPSLITSIVPRTPHPYTQEEPYKDMSGAHIFFVGDDTETPLEVSETFEEIRKLLED